MLILLMISPAAVNFLLRFVSDDAMKIAYLRTKYLILCRCDESKRTIVTTAAKAEKFTTYGARQDYFF